MDAADEETLQDVIKALRSISQPYIEQAINETLLQSEFLTIDLDLTGRRVSPNSSDYPGAEFGHMADQIAKGYQAAVTSLVCERWGRLMLTLQRYSGRARSQDCLVEAVREVEQLLGKRPRRRTSLVKNRIEKLARQLQERQDKLAAHQQQEQVLRSQLAILTQEISSCKEAVEKLEAEYQSQERQVKRYCKLAKARRKLHSAIKRRERCLKKIESEVSRQRRICREIEAPKSEQLALNEWLNTLEADNQSNPNPIKIVLRVDAGFSTGKNLTWLIECGYTILTKVHHSSSAHKWQRGLPSNASWTKVGKNAEATLVEDANQDSCPYPYQAMLVRYRLGEKTRLTSLLYYDESPPPDLADWFKWYNQRQTIEAGIKEVKGVFTLKRHLVRSPIGMKLQEQFALFSANFLRWAAAWVKSLLNSASPKFIKTLGQVKNTVRVLAYTRARWIRDQMGERLIIDESSQFAGTIIYLSERRHEICTVELVLN